jgi:glycosyltransferase involved in cell wall biosynthesis
MRLDDRRSLWVVTPGLDRRGGTERCTSEELSRWRARFAVRVFTQERASVALTACTARRVRSVPVPQLVRYWWWFASNHLARAVARRSAGAPAVTHSPGVNCLDAEAIGVHMLFGRHRALTDPTGTPALSRLRLMHQRWYASTLSAMEGRIYTGPALLWACSQRDASDLEERFGRPPGTVAVVPHGVDSDALAPSRREELRPQMRNRLGLSEDEILVLLIGNDLLTKGADLAADAVSTLPANYHLAIAGRASQDEVRSLDPSGALGGRLMPLPLVDEVMTHLAAADVLVAPSRQDSFNLPVLEALASGLPVVVSQAAGVTELLEDERHAIVVTDPTNPSALAKAIRRSSEDGELRQTLIREGRALAERFTWDRNAALTGDLIEHEARTPRVLVLAPEARGVGGIQRATRALSAALSDAYGDDRIGILSVRAADQPARGRFLREGVPGDAERRVTAFEKARFFVHAVRTARRWRRRLAIVATHPHLAPVANMCSKVSGAPFAVWCHGIEAWGRPKPAVARALRAADIVFAPSRFTAERVERTAGLSREVRVIPHAVSHDVPGAESRSPAGSGSVLTVARLTRENRYKGIDMLLYAWPRVVAATGKRLVIVGDGPDRVRLESIAELLGILDYVVFKGRLSDGELGREYADASVFAMPARHRLEPTPEGEGFGLVYVEAGAHGLPVVAGAGAGADDAVDDGVSGILVDAEDAQKVAAAIVNLLQDPELARKLGEGGRELARTRFSVELFRESVDEMIRTMRPPGLVI